MKALHTVLCLTAITVFAVAAEETPRIVLETGTNEIPVSVINTLNRDIEGLSIDTSQSDLPQWLSVEGTLRSIDIRCGENGKEQLVLIMTVTDAPQGAEALVPFMLKDAMGKRCSSQSRKHTRNSGTDETNNIDPIGNIYGLGTYNWQYHQHGWLSNIVYDTVLKFENETYPPTNMTQGDYDNNLGFSYDNTFTGNVDLEY
jgi:hypothetical protein